MVVFTIWEFKIWEYRSESSQFASVRNMSVKVFATKLWQNCWMHSYRNIVILLLKMQSFSTTRNWTIMET